MTIPAAENGTAADPLCRLGTALADPTRRRILGRLCQAPAYPAELAEWLGTTRANVSNHLACLRGCGLVDTVPQGRRVLYRLSDLRVGDALTRLADLVEG